MFRWKDYEENTCLFIEGIETNVAVLRYKDFQLTDATTGNKFKMKSSCIAEAKIDAEREIMIKISGNVGKSVIVDAIKKYNNARIYSYDKELIPVMESYHVNSDECSIKEFCEYILEDIDSLSSKQLPVNMVVIYTNLTDKHDITMVEDYANTLEFERKVGTVVVTSKI